MNARVRNGLRALDALAKRFDEAACDPARSGGAGAAFEVRLAAAEIRAGLEAGREQVPGMGEFYDRVAANTLWLIRARGFLKSELAGLAGVSVTGLNNLLSCSRMSTAWTVCRVARALDVNTERLYAVKSEEIGNGESGD